MLKFQIFYNGQESYDNLLITYDEATGVWSKTSTKYNTGIFGNFWPHKRTRKIQHNLNLKVNIYNKEYTFTSSEVAFQASKCKDPAQIELFTGQNFHSLDSFRLGRQVNLRDDWEYTKIDVMLNVLECKFTQNEDLKQVLLSSGDAYLVEHTPNKGRDKYWADDCDGSGQNNLGLCLMSVRKKLGGNLPNPKCKEMLPELYKFIKQLK